MIHSSQRMEIQQFFGSMGSKNWNEVEDEHNAGPPYNPLLYFCDIILKHEKYKPKEDMVQDYSSEKTSDSYSDDADVSFNSSEKLNVDSGSDNLDLVTCFCMKPFRGRPMIECSMCGRWLHMSCAKVKRNNVPDVFHCKRCQYSKSRKRRSQRIRSDERS